METMETEDLCLAHHLADVADALSLRQFWRGPVAAGRKPDGTAVSAAEAETEIEIEIEEAILAILARERPRDAVLGEESGRHGTGARRWIVDPIDGTESFLARGRLWATSIALTLDGEPCLGVVSVPCMGIRVWATREGGAFRADCTDRGRVRASRLHVSARRPAEVSRAAAWPPGAAGRPPLSGVWPWQPPCVVPHVDLLAGVLDAWVFVGGAPWELAAFAVLVEAAGGRYSDGDGGRRLDTGTAVLSNGGPVSTTRWSAGSPRRRTRRRTDARRRPPQGLPGA